ncbi:hypothetical protein LSTR_LSTR004740 [Laodelphax striatellus]|uniref:Uncharacterized protein n=1 Tax=Laodelphax striatellus TaxID=195883 RepID=A0A482XK35_LAOST|nr:hypothetical protein LSTR_LSTR004740 [Laodelphax striatellus]
MFTPLECAGGRESLVDASVTRWRRHWRLQLATSSENETKLFASKVKLAPPPKATTESRLPTVRSNNAAQEAASAY